MHWMEIAPLQLTPPLSDYVFHVGTEKCTQHYQVSVCFPVFCYCIFIILQSFRYSHQTLLHPFLLHLLLPTRADPVLPPLSGLPLPHHLRAAVQFAPPRRGCVPVAEGAVPVCGDFLFASAGLFVTKRDVTVRQKGETATKVKSSLKKKFKDLLHRKELWLLSTPRTLERFSRLQRHRILELWPFWDMMALWQLIGATL